MLSAGLPVLAAGPLAALYGRAVALRNRLFDAGILSVGRAPLPVISVGNLVVGGSGKTPLVAAVAARLLGAGVGCAILSRGYGRRDRRGRYVAPGEPLPGWEAIGDEPWLLGRRLEGVALGIDAHRIRAVRRLAPRLGGGVFVLDDGFQHRRLARDLDIVTIDAGDPWGGGRLLPAGRLREPPAALGRADWVVITGGERAARVAEVRRALAQWAPRARIAEACLRWGGLRAGGAPGSRATAGGGPPAAAGVAPPEPTPATAGDARGPAVLVSGIARPERFAATVTAAGIPVCRHLSFPDHHRFAERDARAAIRIAAELGARSIITTEKDEPRLAAVWPAAPPPFRVAVVDLEITAGEAEFTAALLGVCGGGAGGGR